MAQPPKDAPEAASAATQSSQPVPALTPRPPRPLAPRSRKLRFLLGRIFLWCCTMLSPPSARAGDPVYLETLFPVMIDGRVVIPAGSYVSGEITESKRPGRVKGRGELMLKLTTIILPNAYMVKLSATPGGSAGTGGGGETMDKEGKVTGDSDKTSDVATIAKTTAAGAGIGAIAARTGQGAGIGAGAGAAIGIMSVLAVARARSGIAARFHFRCGNRQNPSARCR